MTSSDDILLLFGANLKKVRTNKKISQENLALSSGFDRTYVSLLERGKRNPSLTTIWRLANFLEIDVKEFFNKERM